MNKSEEKRILHEKIISDLLDPYKFHSSAELSYAMEILKLRSEINRLNSHIPKINIECVVDVGHPIRGSTSLNVIRVEREDDGSFTAVTDHWPRKEVERLNWVEKTALAHSVFGNPIPLSAYKLIEAVENSIQTKIKRGY